MLDDDLTAVQAAIDDDPHVANYLCASMRAETIVDVLVTWHVQDCQPLQAWLARRRIDPARVVAANPSRGRRARERARGRTR